MNVPGTAALVLLAVLTFFAWFGWILFKGPHSVVAWCVAVIGVTVFTGAFTWFAGRHNDVVSFALAGGFCTAIGAIGYWIKFEALDFLTNRDQSKE